MINNNLNDILLLYKIQQQQADLSSTVVAYCGQLPANCPFMRTHSIISLLLKPSLPHILKPISGSVFKYNFGTIIALC